MQGRRSRQAARNARKLLTERRRSAISHATVWAFSLDEGIKLIDPRTDLVVRESSHHLTEKVRARWMNGSAWPDTARPRPLVT